MACINNYAWINSSSGLSFSSSSILTIKGLSCVPCDSPYVRSGLVGSSQKLYSIWNKGNNITAVIPSAVGGSALQSMAGKVGGCYLCPGFGNREVVDSSTEMCELKPGMTAQNQGVGSTAVIYASVVLSSQSSLLLSSKIPIFRSEEDNNNNNNNRRLLSAAAATTTTTTVSTPNLMYVRVQRQPIVLGANYFYCCSTLPSKSQVQDCQDQYMAELESKKELQGSKWAGAGDFCDSITLGKKEGGGAKRRLLQLSLPPAVDSGASNNNNNNTEGKEEREGDCYSGTFKEKRGDGPCLACPAGASTTYPYAGVTSRHKCACLPGYSAERNISTGALIYCKECGLNYYRPPNSNNDSVCFPCGPNAYTSTTTSAYCYCNPGTYLSDNSNSSSSNTNSLSSCEPCRPGSYCVNNVEMQCPPNSMSPAFSKKREDCTCNPPLYYGSLSLPNSQCIRSPPGLKCISLNNSCSCGDGWDAMVQVTFSQSNDIYMMVKCKSPCLAGQYAVLGNAREIKECKNCPVDTFSEKEDETMEFPGKPHQA